MSPDADSQDAVVDDTANGGAEEELQEPQHLIINENFLTTADYLRSHFDSRCAYF
jgi:hypothetical protein